MPSFKLPPSNALLQSTSFNRPASDELRQMPSFKRPPSNALLQSTPFNRLASDELRSRDAVSAAVTQFPQPGRISRSRDAVSTAMTVTHFLLPGQGSCYREGVSATGRCFHTMKWQTNITSTSQWLQTSGNTHKIIGHVTMCHNIQYKVICSFKSLHLNPT